MSACGPARDQGVDRRVKSLIEPDYLGLTLAPIHMLTPCDTMHAVRRTLPLR